MIWVFLLVAWVAFSIGFLTACFLTATGPDGPPWRESEGQGRVDRRLPQKPSPPDGAPSDQDSKRPVRDIRGELG